MKLVCIILPKQINVDIKVLKNYPYLVCDIKLIRIWHQKQIKLPLQILVNRAWVYYLWVLSLRIFIPVYICRAQTLWRYKLKPALLHLKLYVVCQQVYKFGKHIRLFKLYRQNFLIKHAVQVSTHFNVRILEIWSKPTQYPHFKELQGCWVDDKSNCTWCFHDFTLLKITFCYVVSEHALGLIVLYSKLSTGAALRFVKSYDRVPYQTAFTFELCHANQTSPSPWNNKGALVTNCLVAAFYCERHVLIAYKWATNLTNDVGVLLEYWHL